MSVDTTDDGPTTSICEMAGRYFMLFDDMKFQLRQRAGDSGWQWTDDPTTFPHIQYLTDYFKAEVKATLDDAAPDIVRLWRRLTKAQPWLRDFRKTTGGFQQSLTYYHKERIAMVTQLISFLELAYCATLVACYSVVHFLEVKKPEQYDRLSPVRQRNGVRLDHNTDALEHFISAVSDASNSYEFAMITSRVKEFAEMAGYGSPAGAIQLDVFTYVNYLHGKAFESSQNQRIDELEAENAALKKNKGVHEERARTQNRIIACLSLRHILERLPPAIPGKIEKHSWDAFWKSAVDHAIGDKDSPLSSLVTRFARTPDKDQNKEKAKPKEKSSDQSGRKVKDKGKDKGRDYEKPTMSSSEPEVKALAGDQSASHDKSGPEDAGQAKEKKQTMEKDQTWSLDVTNIRKAGGADLYATLSTNIHQFQGEYKLQKDQWHTIEFDILKAIEPLQEHIFPDGTVHWEKERTRFVPSKPDASSAPASSGSADASSSIGTDPALTARVSAPDKRP